MARSNPTPSGNGLDTFRTWETMALGRVAVVLSGQLHEDVLFAGLPVVRVPSWPAEAAAAWDGESVAGDSLAGGHPTMLPTCSHFAKNRRHWGNAGQFGVLTPEREKRATTFPLTPNVPAHSRPKASEPLVCSMYADSKHR